MDFSIQRLNEVKLFFPEKCDALTSTTNDMRNQSES